MNSAVALRLTRSKLASAPVKSGLRRCVATTANPSHVSTTSSSSAPTTVIPLSNVEAQWAKLNVDERLAVHDMLEQLQKKDWTTLSVDEKKAAYYVAFGPHGPRTPASKPGDAIRIFLSVSALVGLTGIAFAFIRSQAPPAPKTITREWEAATNEYAKKQKMDPITGIASEGYKGKGFLTK